MECLCACRNIEKAADDKLTQKQGRKQLPQVIHKAGRGFESHNVTLLQGVLGLYPVDPVEYPCRLRISVKAAYTHFQA